MCFLLRERIFSTLGRALVEDNGPQKADCILVLGGDDYGTRIVKAGELAKAGYAPYVLVDGPNKLIGHESDTTIRFAVQKGFPANLFRAVWLPGGVDSTSTESEYVANQILKPAKVRRVILVTSSYHTRRAARFLRSAAPWLKVDVVPAPDPFFSVNGWWKSRNGEKTFFLEWTKTITEWWGA